MEPVSNFIINPLLLLFIPRKDFHRKLIVADLTYRHLTFIGKNSLYSWEASFLSTSQRNCICAVLGSTSCRHLCICNMLQRNEIADTCIDILYSPSGLRICAVLFPGDIVLLHHILDELKSGLSFGLEGRYNNGLAYLLGNLAKAHFH